MAESYRYEEFRVICAWCQGLIRAPRMSTAGREVPESHGVCKSCAVQMGAPPELFSQAS